VIVLRSVAKRETPISKGCMPPLPVKYSAMVFWRRLKYHPRPMVEVA